MSSFDTKCPALAYVSILQRTFPRAIARCRAVKHLVMVEADTSRMLAEASTVLTVLDIAVPLADRSLPLD